MTISLFVSFNLTEARFSLRVYMYTINIRIECEERESIYILVIWYWQVSWKVGIFISKLVYFVKSEFYRYFIFFFPTQSQKLLRSQSSRVIVTRPIDIMLSSTMYTLSNSSKKSPASDRRLLFIAGQSYINENNFWSSIEILANYEIKILEKIIKISSNRAELIFHKFGPELSKSEDSILLLTLRPRQK